MSEVSKPFYYPAGVLKNVRLVNGFSIQTDEDWGQTVCYDRILELANAVLVSVLRKLGRLDAAEVAYLRLKLDLTQAEISAFLGTSEQTFSLWERGKYEIPQITDGALRQVVIQELGKDVPLELRRVGLKALVTWAANRVGGEHVLQFDQMAGWSGHFQPGVEASDAPGAYVAQAISNVNVPMIIGATWQITQFERRDAMAAGAPKELEPMWWEVAPWPIVEQFGSNGPPLSTNVSPLPGFEIGDKNVVRQVSLKSSSVLAEIGRTGNLCH